MYATLSRAPRNTGSVVDFFVFFAAFLAQDTYLVFTNAPVGKIKNRRCASRTSPHLPFPHASLFSLSSHESSNKHVTRDLPAEEEQQGESLRGEQYLECDCGSRVSWPRPSSCLLLCAEVGPTHLLLSCGCVVKPRRHSKRYLSHSSTTII